MARTRGGLGRPIEGGERRRPTASARRQREAEIAAEVPVVDGVTEVEDVPVHEDDGSACESFPGGPEDLSVLTDYANHVAVRVWTREERSELKLASHGRKVAKLGKPALEIEGLVAATGLSPLISTSMDTGDRGLLSAFVERWHAETSSFHFPIGELSITLDDVAALLHLPIQGNFQTFDNIDVGEAITLIVELLEVSVEDARAETEQCHGAYVRLSWLRELYAVKCEARQWIVAARAYLLHLVGCTIFANKSSTHISVLFLDAFCDLDQSGGYAWGAAALVHIYDHLGYASQHHGKHLAGYISLIQCWVYEHFSTIGSVMPNPDYEERAPRACRWRPGKALPVSTYRKRLDRLTLDDVVWSPYREHRAYREFETISLFSGFIRWGPLIVRHLPERVMRQYGCVQGIPHLSRPVSMSTEEVDECWGHFLDYVVAQEHLVTYPAQCVNEYMPWFYRISHPFMRPAKPGEPPRHPFRVTTILHYHPTPACPPGSPPSAPRVPNADDPAADVGDMAPHAVGMCRRIRRGLQRMIDLRIVIPGTDAYACTQELLELVSSVHDDRNVYVRSNRRRDTIRRRHHGPE